MDDIAAFITQDNFLALLERCEQLEIQSTNDANIDMSQVYPIYLASCLLAGDLQTARHVRKRTLNTQTAEIDAIWRVIADFITKNYAQIYQDLDQFQWSDYMQLLTQKIRLHLREYMVQMISSVYSSIHIQQAASYFGVPEDKVVQDSIQRGWKYDEAAKLLYPVKPTAPVSSSIRSDPDQFSKLADIVLSLERF